MAMPTPHRRAFSQIQNTITTSAKVSFSKNAINRQNVDAQAKGTEKENADKVLAAVNNKKLSIEKESTVDVAKQSDVFKPFRYEVPGETFDYLDNFDFDAPIEYAPPDSPPPSVLNDDDDILFPEKRVSYLGPHSDHYNKEIFDQLFANITDDCEPDRLDLQNLSLDNTITSSIKAPLEIEKESTADVAQQSNVNKPFRYEVPGETFDYLDNFDFDASIEYCPPESPPPVFSRSWLYGDMDDFANISYCEPDRIDFENLFLDE